MSYWELETITTGRDVYWIEASSAAEARAVLMSGTVDPIVSEVISVEEVNSPKEVKLS